jgi:hypothetical protein
MGRYAEQSSVSAYQPVEGTIGLPFPLAIVMNWTTPLKE